MDGINGKLHEDGGNSYSVIFKRKFIKLGQLENEDKVECFEFAYDMAFGAGSHRKIRSGGKKERNKGEIFINTFQGKAAEFAMYRYLLKEDIVTTKPDTNVEGYGIWDSFDLEYGSLHLAVKSTKSYGNLLLLETKDWNENGEYIPNLQNGVSNYDMFVLIRLSPDGERIMKQNRLYYCDSIRREVLEEIIIKIDWEYDVAGFITNKDFVRLIKKGYILPQGAILNQRTRMDADNYYVQAGNMRTNEEMIRRLLKYKHMFENVLTEEK